jgi:N-acyl-D-amino-acid deacylase
VRSLDFLIKGGLILDGTGAPPTHYNIGLKGEKIAYMGAESPEADEVINAEGLYVSPGFIDTHAHSDFTLLADPEAAQGKLFQGVTTEINGNCGMSGGPLLGRAKAQREEDLKRLEIKPRWNSLREYLRLLEETGLYYNFCTLAGHGNLRASVIGYENRAPSKAEVEEIKKLLRESLEAGALGMSTGLIYPPGVYSTTEELLELAAYGHSVDPEFIYATHMRNEGDRLIEAITEAIEIGKAAGRLQISHLKTGGERNWLKIDDALTLIEREKAGGARISADRYPYTAAATDLEAVLPDWMYEGGNQTELERLKDPLVREKLKDEIKRGPGEWERIVVSDTADPEDKWTEGKNMIEIAHELGMEPLQAVIHLLIRSGLSVGAIFHSMSEENLKKIYSRPWVMVGSDSSTRAFGGITATGKPHPRGFGTFPRFLKRYTIKEEDLSESIRKITSLSAEVFGLKGRGLLRENMAADIAVWDFEKLRDTADFERPFGRAEGVIHLFVNGRCVIKDGSLTGGRGGKILSHAV